MSVILTLRVSAQQRKRWQEAANREGLRISAWMRNRCDAEQKGEGNEQTEKSQRERLLELIYGEG